MNNILKKIEDFIGKHNDVSDSKFDSHQLALGIKIEMEHTKHRNIARAIAKDHLSEDPKYYSKLKKMEKGE